MNDRLTPELVLSAYCQGCFPMADPETGEISFYEPDPRALIPLDDRFHIPHGLKRALNKNLLNSGWIPLFRRWCMPAPGRSSRKNNG